MYFIEIEKFTEKKRFLDVVGIKDYKEVHMNEFTGIQKTSHKFFEINKHILKNLITESSVK